MRRFASLYQLLTSGASIRTADTAIRSYFEQTAPPDSHWAYALLTEARFPRCITPVRLRDWIARLSGFPMWMVETCHQQSGHWPETLAKLTATQSTSPVDRLSDFMELKVCALCRLDQDQQRSVVVEVYPNLTETERVLYIQWLSGAYRVPKAVREAMSGANVEPRPPPHSLRPQSQQNWLFDQ